MLALWLVGAGLVLLWLRIVNRQVDAVDVLFAALWWAAPVLLVLAWGASSLAFNRGRMARRARFTAH